MRSIMVYQIVLALLTVSYVKGDKVPPTQTDLKTDSANFPPYSLYSNNGPLRGQQLGLHNRPLSPPPLALQGFQPSPSPLACRAGPQLDPYLLHLLAHYMRYLPYGLGPYGFFGSTGLPQFKPPGPSRCVDKVDQISC